MASKNHSGPGYKYSRLLSTVAVYSRDTAAHSKPQSLIGNSLISGAAPGFPALDDADLFPGPPLSYFMREVDEGWLVMALALGLESLLSKNPHS
jgi:hypothetical protein